MIAANQGGMAETFAGAILQSKAEKYIGGGFLVGAVVGLGFQVQKGNQSPPTAVSPPAPEKTVEERMQALTELREKGLIDEDQFEVKKRFINRETTLTSSTQPKRAKTVEERLQALVEQREKRLIDDDEYETRKRFILRDV